MTYVSPLLYGYMLTQFSLDTEPPDLIQEGTLCFGVCTGQDGLILMFDLRAVSTSVSIN